MLYSRLQAVKRISLALVEKHGHGEKLMFEYTFISWYRMNIICSVILQQGTGASRDGIPIRSGAGTRHDCHSLCGLVQAISISMTARKRRNRQVGQVYRPSSASLLDGVHSYLRPLERQLSRNHTGPVIKASFWYWGSGLAGWFHACVYFFLFHFFSRPPTRLNVRQKNKLSKNWRWRVRISRTRVSIHIWLNGERVVCPVAVSESPLL